MVSCVRFLFLVFFSLSLLNCSSHNPKEKKNPTMGEIKGVMKKVADWQIQNHTYKTSGNLHDYGIDSWTNGTLYIGMLEWANIAGNPVYMNWLSDIGNINDWKIPANFLDYPRYKYYHADELCIGQFYLSMYDVTKDKKILNSVKERVDLIMKNPGDSSMSYKNKQVWSWCDALFMAPPVYVHLYEITGDDRYLEYMDREFKRTYNHLYNEEQNLFFRDDSFFEKKEANGKNIFWGRGNGWVAAGLVSILKILPEQSSYRPFYLELYKKFVPDLVQYQDESGFWHASLLDPDSYPSPETSATAMITYSLAYGINEGLLDKKKYREVVNKAWNALTSAVDENGKLGWVQPIGADPKKVTADMTAVYGVGAFLLAGTEVCRLENN